MVVVKAYQSDWSQEVVLIVGVTTMVKVAHVRLSYSRMPFVRAYLPFAQTGGQLLFHLISKLFEPVLTIVATNLAIGE